MVYGYIDMGSYIDLLKYISCKLLTCTFLSHLFLRLSFTFRLAPFLLFTDVTLTACPDHKKPPSMITFGKLKKKHIKECQSHFFVNVSCI